jgi:glycosyltransferase involved in cell wall biosynthesis
VRNLVVVLTHYPAGEGRSMAAYRQLLAEGLAEQGWAVRCRTAPVLLGGLAPGRSGAGKWLGYFDQLLIFPLLLALEQRRWPAGTRVLVSDQALGPWVPWIRHWPHLIICHDLLALRASRGEFPQLAVGLSGRLYQRLIRWGFRQGHNFAAVSAASAAELAQELAPRRPPIQVLPNPLAPGLCPLAPEQTGPLLAELAAPLAKAPFLLHVGGYWYKNREGVLAVFSALLRRRPELRLVLVGHLEAPARAALAADPAAAAATVQLSGVKAHALQALYSAAAALLFPSWWEGFGWPVLEALACGCPVITTDRAPMREVGGGAATYLPPCPNEPAERDAWILQAAAVVEGVLKRDPVEQQLWRAQGLAQAERFNRDNWLNQLTEALECAGSQG